MPKMPPKQCTSPGCPNYAVYRGKCEAHRKEATGQWKGKRDVGRLPGWEWARVRKRILERDAWLCQPCTRAGRVVKATEVDHIKPKSQGGTDSPDNLEAICKTCHEEKSKQEAKQGDRR